MNTAESDFGFLARHSTLRRSVALLLAAILSAGCVSWQSGTAGPYYALIDQHPEKARVSLEHGGRMVLHAPTFAGDSLVGYRRPGVEASRIAIPLRDVTRIEVKRVDASRTALLAGAVSIAVALFIIGGIEMQDAFGHIY